MEEDSSERALSVVSLGTPAKEGAALLGQRDLKERDPLSQPLPPPAGSLGLSPLPGLVVITWQARNQGWIYRQ